MARRPTTPKPTSQPSPQSSPETPQPEAPQPPDRTDAAGDGTEAGTEAEATLPLAGVPDAAAVRPGRGGYRGGGRPKLPKVAQRLPLRAHIAPETAREIEAYRARYPLSRLSLGDVVDRAVRALIRAEMDDRSAEDRAAAEVGDENDPENP